MDKNQTDKYSEGEIEILKQAYENNTDLFLMLRDHFLQLGTDEHLKELTPDFLEVFGKGIFFELRNDLPITQQATMYSGLSMLEQLHPEMGIILIQAADLVNDYVKQQLEILTSKEEPEIILEELLERFGSVEQKEMRVINTIAYNKLIPIIESKMFLLQSKCAKKEETEEEKIKRLEANSSK